MQLREDWRDHLFGPFDDGASNNGRHKAVPILAAIALLVLLAGACVGAAFLGTLPPVSTEPATLIGP